MRPTAGASAMAVVVLTGCAYAGSPPPVEIGSLELRKVEFHAAVAARDVDRLAGLFARDVVVHVANMPAIRGRDAIYRFYGNMFQFIVDSRATPEMTHASDSGDLAYSTGSVSNVFRGPEGEVEYAGKYALIWSRIDAEWVIVLYAVSSDQAAEPR